MRELLSGNEAIARGAYEAGVRMAVGYPGTPSTEILETIAHRFPLIYAQWSPNEKVAFEVGIGASLGGGRTLVTMKHVGLNVAADPFMTFAYTGVNAGFVVVSADDPAMHSSQNEQDNRVFAKFAKVPFLSPSDSAEAKEMLLAAFEISEAFDTPVMFHLCTRICHSKGIVELAEPTNTQQSQFVPEPSKYVMIPSYARTRRQIMEERLEKLAELAETSPLNVVEKSGSKIGIITGSISYQYTKEVAPDLDYLKIGLGYPLPMKKIQSFIESHDRVLVIEELEPFYEDQIKVAGLPVEGKKFFSNIGELSPSRVAEGLARAGVIPPREESTTNAAKLFPRPPVLCPGCAHRGVFMALRKLKVVVTGDIGCYTLGALEPLNAIDTTICMGASIGNAIGMEKVEGSKTGTVAVIGDSTFFHSGITGLVDAVYNQSNMTLIILDNRATAMTGGQMHPGTGHTLMREPAGTIDIEKLVKGLTVNNYHQIDPYDYEESLRVIKGEINNPGPSVIHALRPCVLMPQRIMDEPYRIDAELCTACSACFRISCPAISASEETNKRGHPKAVIDESTCTGCTLCAQICPEEAILLKSQFAEV